MVAVPAVCAKGKAADEYPFTWPDGKRIRDFRGAWANTTKAAGVPKLRFHDLRRSAVRRLRKLGTATATAMLITGRLSRTIFDDCDQADPEDVAQAAETL